MDDRRTLLLTLGAAGVTLALTFGIVGMPLLQNCVGDPRGTVACLRDMADRRFNLPGEPADEVAVAAPAAVKSADPVAVAEPPEVAVSHTAVPKLPVAMEGSLRGGDRGGGPPLPVPRPERTAYVTVTSPSVRPITPLPTAEAAPAQAATASTPNPLDEPASISEKVSPAKLPEPAAEAARVERQASIPSAIEPPATPISEPTAPVVEPVPEQPASAPAAAAPATAAAPLPAKVGPPGMQPGSVPPIAKALPDVPLAAILTSEPPPTAMASIEPVEPPPEPVTAAPIALAPTIDAIELEGDASYISGSGPAGSVVRLYADGQLVGESQVDEGRWIVETGALLTAPRRELRVEAIEPETGKLLGEAVITVEIQLPKNPPADVPSEPPDTQGEADAPQELAVAPFGDPVRAADTNPPSAPPEPAAVGPTDSELTVEEQVVAPTEHETQEPMDVDVPPSALDEEAAADESEPPYVEETLETDVLPELLPVKPRGETDSVTILPAPSSDQSSAGTGNEPAAPALLAAIEVPASRPTGSPMTILRLVPFGDPVNGRFTGGKALIRHGDTLWSVAHRYYGSGRHYRTIFNANRDLIRRPSRIFPGQVLELPLVTEE